MQSMVHRLSQSVSSAQTLSGMTRPLLEILVELTDLESAYLTTVDEARGVQNVIYSLNTGELNLPEGLEVPWGDTLCKRALDEGRMYTGNVAECWGDSGAARELGIQTYVSTPVRFASGSLYGTLCAASRRSAQLPQDAESALRLFAKIIAGFAEREQLVQSLQQANRELSSLVLLDALTGLPNRRCLTEELHRVISHCRRSREWVLVGFLDLDRFKQINDQHGHEAGDALLCSLGEQLAAAVRSSDMLARFGGDEFVIVGSGPQLIDDGDAIATDLQQRLAAASSITVSLSGGRKLVYEGASVAVISLSPDETDVDDALQKADAAMYRVKAARQKLH
ncbi:MAG: sensor domain-containing diguanylate cyclase [Comamonas sp.]